MRFWTDKQMVFRKLTIVTLALLLCLVHAPEGYCMESQKNSQDAQNIARSFVELLQEEKFSEAERSMDVTMKQALAGGKLALLWKQLLGQFGPFEKVIDRKSEPLPHGYVKEVLVCAFQKCRKELLVTVSTAGEVSGFFVREPAAGSIEPPYAQRSKFSEESMKLGEGDFALKATLSMPLGEGPFPALVLVHGSGAHDMDETVASIKVFRDIAWGLASRKIAVLRYNKRSYEHASQLLPVADTLTLKEETVDDAALAVATLKKINKIDHNRIYVLGHSLGGLAMPRIALAAPDAAGYVIMAGNTRPFEDLILEQSIYLKALAGIQDKSDPGIGRLREQVALVKSPQLSSQTRKEDLPLAIPAAYWLDLRAHDPMKEADNLKKPVLVLQGESDYQVTMKDFEGWKAALASMKNASFVSYPGLGHLFTPMSSHPSPSDYDRQGNVSQKVVEDIAAWILGSSSKDGAGSEK